METVGDFPKLYCPFIRQTFQVDEGDFRRRGQFISSIQLCKTQFPRSGSDISDLPRDDDDSSAGTIGTSFSALPKFRNS